MQYILCAFIFLASTAQNNHFEIHLHFCASIVHSNCWIMATIIIYISKINILSISHVNYVLRNWLYDFVLHLIHIQ